MDNSTETSLNETDTKETDGFNKFVLALYGIICVVGVIGNLLVAIVLLRVPSLRSNTSDFLVHLSIVDFMVCVLVIPTYLTPAGSKTPANPGGFAEFWCRFYTSKFLYWSFAITSVFSLITVNMERYVAIVYPHKYKKVFSRRNKYLMIATCWVLAAITKLYKPCLFEVDREKGCRSVPWPSKGAQAAFGVYNFTVNFFAPFVLMGFAQWRVISSLNRQVKVLNRRADSSVLNPRDQREMWQLRASQTLVKTLLVCVISFVVCWAPNQVRFLLLNLGAPLQQGSHFQFISVILSVGNSCVNPVIYTLTNKPFRKGIRDVFCKKRDSNQVGNSTSGTVATVSQTL
ncbi:galanin receptor type 1-like [Asterias amurensis]|uniref:galanin receptor type 1-like n=1 Tax=Asterias amurensis TaxID=7602 RepID=UPI003AB5631B